MVIIVSSKQAEALDSQRLAEEHLPDPPPTYASVEASEPPSGPESIPQPPHPHAPPTTNLSNFVSIVRVHDSLRETITVDPTLYIPPYVLAPLAADETADTRKHLRLESTHGSIYANITIASCHESTAKCRTRILMKSAHGNVSARIRGFELRHPFQLTAQSTYGNILLRLPRSFQGPIVISLRHGSVKFSDGMNKNLTSFGEANSVRHCFVGDVSKWSISPKSWAGDEIFIETKHGGVKIQYEDDAPGSQVRSRPSLLNRVFGF